ncbi:MAG: hypothetical protein ACJ761_05275 [Chloroflexota bacterium]
MELEPTGFPEFDRLLELVRRTRQLLDAVVGDGELPDGGADYLAETTLPHLEDVQTGFHGWLRSDMAGIAELRHLLLQVAVTRVDPAQTDAERLAAVAEARAESSAGLRGPVLRFTGSEAWQLAALTHARLVLAFLPKLPEVAIRFPLGIRTYADIPTPRGPAELAARIDELEQQLYRTAIGRPSGRHDPAFRRTYGFFDAAETFGRGAFRVA